MMHAPAPLPDVAAVHLTCNALAISSSASELIHVGQTVTTSGDLNHLGSGSVPRLEPGQAVGAVA